MKKISSLAAVAAVALTIGILGSVPAAAGGGTSTIWGVVTADGAPVVGQTVKVYAAEGGYGAAMTDAAGAYSVDGLDPGTYTVEVDRTYYGDTVREPESTKVAVAAGGSYLANIHLVVFSGVAKGWVVRSSGTPVANVEVEVSQTNGLGRAWATTDVNGRYVARGLPAGKYLVEVVRNSEDHYPQVFTAGGALTPAIIAVKSGATTTAKTFRLPRVGKVTGIVKASPELDLLTVVLYPRNHENHEVTGEVVGNGRFTIPYVAAGSYDVWVDGKGYVGKVVVKAGKTLKLKTVRLPKGAKIWGYLRRANGALATAGYVSLFDSKGHTVGLEMVSSHGKYVFTGLGAGTYRLIASVYDGAPAVALGNASSKRYTAKVKVGKTVKRSISLRKQAVVRGYVRNSNGVGVEGVEVFVEDPSGLDVSVRTNANGYYVLRHVAPGTTRVKTSDPYLGGYLDNRSKTFTVKSGHVYTKSIVIRK